MSVVFAYEFEPIGCVVYRSCPVAAPTLSGRNCDNCGASGAKLLYLPEIKEGVYLCHDCAMKALRLVIAPEQAYDLLDVMSTERKRKGFRVVRGGKTEPEKDGVKPA